VVVMRFKLTFFAPPLIMQAPKRNEHCETDECGPSFFPLVKKKTVCEARAIRKPLELAFE
jgi:hypothetical protein